MMAGPSTNFETHILNQIASSSESGAYAATFIALFTDDPTDEATGTEVTGGSYTRAEVNQDGATGPYWSAPADDANDGKRFTKNVGAVAFVVPTASWGVVSHWGLFDAQVNGNMIWSGQWNAAKVVDADNPANIADGKLILKIE